MHEEVDLIIEELIKESGSNSMSLIILNCQFCKKWFTSKYGFVADY